MRTRKEIIKQSNNSIGGLDSYSAFSRIMEVLLDIRELLINKDSISTEEAPKVSFIGELPEKRSQEEINKIMGRDVKEEHKDLLDKELLDKDYDTCLKHGTYCIGTTCKECVKDKLNATDGGHEK